MIINIIHFKVIIFFSIIYIVNSKSFYQYILNYNSADYMHNNNHFKTHMK